MTPILEMDHVSFAYDRNPILTDVNLAIYPGEFVGLIGPNGGGKTTLLKLILGFNRPAKGTIRVLEHSPRSTSVHHCMAYVPQSLRYDREFPISSLEVVLSGLLSQLPWYGKFKSKELKLAHEALEQVGMEEYCHHPFGQLSGGQAQRVLIARALVAKPCLLLLDEPTASVDSKAEADIHAILNRLKGQMTIIMVTHDLSAAASLVDRLFCVQGKVFELDPKEICEHYALGLYHDPLIQINRLKKGGDALIP